MPLNEGEMFELFVDMAEQIGELGATSFDELMKARGVDASEVMAAGLRIAATLDETLNLRHWSCAFCMGFMLGHEMALKQMGREVFGETPQAEG